MADGDHLRLYIIPFALLMWYHNKMYARKVYAETLIKLNEDELKGLDYDFSALRRGGR